MDDDMLIMDEPEQDIIPHLVMQFKKSIDVGGKYLITFQDGEKCSVPITVIRTFMYIYQHLKPIDREAMQSMASKNLLGLTEAINYYLNTETAPKTIYG